MNHKNLFILLPIMSISAAFAGYSSSQTPPQKVLWEHHSQDYNVSITAPSASSVPRDNQSFYVSTVRKQHQHHAHWSKEQFGNLPSHPVAGGFENGNILFVCRGNYNGGMHPGKLVGNSCNFGYGGSEISTQNYEVLSTKAAVNWVQAKHGIIPANAIDGGYEKGQTLFICQAKYNHGMHPGKVVGNTCNFSWGGREVVTQRFNVLVG